MIPVPSRTRRILLGYLPLGLVYLALLGPALVLEPLRWILDKGLDGIVWVMRKITVLTGHWSGVTAYREAVKDARRKAALEALADEAAQ